VRNMPLKIDLHVHTCYSGDTATTLEEVVTYAKRRGLDGIAVTDHDTVAGALELLKNYDLLVIPGIEIETSCGHIIGLNVAQTIPQGLGAAETIERIHESGGLAVVAHPFAAFKSGWKSRVLSSLKVDAIEVKNSSNFPFLLTTYLSGRLAARLNLPQTAGSDAHIPQAIGTAYTLIEADSDAELEEIIQAIKGGAVTPCGGAMPWALRFKNLFRKRK